MFWLLIHLMKCIRGRPADRAHPAQYLLGTDQIGRDFLSRLIYWRLVFRYLIGLAATALDVLSISYPDRRHLQDSLVVSLTWLVQRVVDAWIVFPGLLLLLTIMSIVGQRSTTDNTGPGRYQEASLAQQTNPKRRYRHKGERDNFLAAEAVGSTKWRSFIRHVLPNVMPVVIIMFSHQHRRRRDYR